MSSVSAQDADDEPPVVGQPLNYGGGIGQFSVTMRIDRSAVRVEEALTLTLRITGSGNLDRLPRPDLRLLPSIRERFHVENMSDRYLPSEQAREFDYRLRPLNPDVQFVPSVPFVYYRPARNGRGWYQTAYTNEGKEVPLTIAPSLALEPPIETEPWMLQRADRLAVLQRSGGLTTFTGLLFVGIALGPPLACAAWYGLWRLRHPVTAHLARQRRSRAATQALAALHAIRRPSAAETAQECAAVVVSYARQRYDLPFGRPAPADVVAHWCILGHPATAQASAFFRACDAARFAPAAEVSGAELIVSAEQLIGAFEEAWPCPVA